jgi:glutathione S-transferase
MAALELFVLEWGVYPHRITLYLAEAGLLQSPHIKITVVIPDDMGKMSAPGKPPGSVPNLRLPDGTFIMQSTAILEYLDEIITRPDPEQSWQKEISLAAGGRSLLGSTAKERALTRDMLSDADEATIMFTYAAHKGSKLFETFEETSAVASRLTMEQCRARLTALDKAYEKLGRIGERQANVCDCVLFSLLEFADKVYGLDLCAQANLPSLRAFYEDFGKRPSARDTAAEGPKMICDLARQWIAEA